MRVSLTTNPFPAVGAPGSHEGFRFPVHWIWHPAAVNGTAAVLVFRLCFKLEQAATIRLHVSADQRYELSCDGIRQGRGPERGDPAHWSFETYDLELSAGSHLLAAKVWWLPNDGSPMAQMTLVPGFLVMAEGEYMQLLSTGTGAWQVCKLDTYAQEPVHIRAYFVVGWSFQVNGAKIPWNWQTDPEAPGDWVKPAVLRVPVGGRHNPWYGHETSDRLPAPYLVPAQLPPMLEINRNLGIVRQAEKQGPFGAQVSPEKHDAALAAAWQSLLNQNQALTLAPGSQQRIIIDLGDYFCAFPELTVSGGQGTEVTLGWAESLFVNENAQGMDKGKRDEVINKYFYGPHDRFLLEGGANRKYDTLWWRCGRYVELLITVGNQPVTIDSLIWRETRYPLENNSKFTSSDPRLADAIPMMYRTLQMCSHETYMDCPFYEQLMYVGDGRLEVLVTYLTNAECRLPSKAVQLFDWSRAADGLTKSRYPSQIPQVIPGFSMWWVAMVHDLMMWRGEKEAIRKMLPGVDAVLGGLELYMSDTNLLQAPRGWNFCDWVPTWDAGVPPDGFDGYSALLNLQYVYALQRGAWLHEAYGQRHLAAHWQELADKLKTAIAATYWDPARGLLADDPAHNTFSEHVQALAILTGTLDAARQASMVHNLLTAEMSRCTVYFSHYLLEALAQVGQMDAFFERLNFWFDLAKQGFKTVLESPEPSRSDCHAWGAHPIYHYFTSVFGARPVTPGATQLQIKPQLGTLKTISGSFPHASGSEVQFDLRVTGSDLAGTITLPAQVSATLIWQGREIKLGPGINKL
ncbi:MAG: alpha-L-rhamnosidase-related protein [Anaerolineae bacterium]